MYYRIADLTLFSDTELPSFAPFACEAADADVTLTCTEERAPEGEEIVSGSVIHRILPDGWFCHSPADDETGLFISGDYTYLRLSEKEPLVAERYVRLALECLLIRRGYVSIHAAAVETEGAAYAFSGPSGIGKSTRARAWEEAVNARFLSGDRPLLRVKDLEVFGVPWDGKEQCFRSAHFPLKALCEIRRADSVYLRKLSPDQARRFLVRQCFLPMWDTETALIQMTNIFQLASRAELVRAFCGHSAQDALRLRQLIDTQTYRKEELEMKAKPGFVLRNVVGEYMLMPTGENVGAYRGSVLLNSVSAFVWEKLQAPVSRDDLLIAILDHFDVEEAAAAADLDELLEQLRTLNVLEME